MSLAIESKFTFIWRNSSKQSSTLASCADKKALAEQRPVDQETSLQTWEGPEEKTGIQKFLYPEPEDLPDDFSMPIWDHLDELRERVIVAALAAATAVLTCFCFSKDLVVFLEAPVAQQGVRFLQLSPGEFFFTTIKVRSPGSCLHEDERMLSSHMSCL